MFQNPKTVSQSAVEEAASEPTSSYHNTSESESDSQSVTSTPSKPMSPAYSRVGRTRKRGFQWRDSFDSTASNTPASSRENTPTRTFSRSRGRGRGRYSRDVTPVSPSRENSPCTVSESSHACSVSHESSPVSVGGGGWKGRKQQRRSPRLECPGTGINGSSKRADDTEGSSKVDPNAVDSPSGHARKLDSLSASQDGPPVNTGVDNMTDKTVQSGCELTENAAQQKQTGNTSLLRELANGCVKSGMQDSDSEHEDSILPEEWLHSNASVRVGRSGMESGSQNSQENAPCGNSGGGNGAPNTSRPVNTSACGEINSDSCQELLTSAVEFRSSSMDIPDMQVSGATSPAGFDSVVNSESGDIMSDPEKGPSGIVDSATTDTATTDSTTTDGTAKQEQDCVTKTEEGQLLQKLKLEAEVEDMEQCDIKRAQLADRLPQKTEANSTTEPKTEADDMTEPKTEADDMTQPKTEADNVIEAKTEADNVVEAKTEADNVVEAKTEADKVVEAKTEADKVVEAKTEADKVVEVKAEADNVVDPKTEADDVVEPKTEVGSVIGAKKDNISSSGDSCISAKSAKAEDLTVTCTEVKDPVSAVAEDKPSVGEDLNNEQQTEKVSIHGDVKCPKDDSVAADKMSAVSGDLVESPTQEPEPAVSYWMQFTEVVYFYSPEFSKFLEMHLKCITVMQKRPE